MRFPIFNEPSDRFLHDSVLRRLALAVVVLLGVLLSALYVSGCTSGDSGSKQSEEIASKAVATTTSLPPTTTTIMQPTTTTLPVPPSYDARQALKYTEAITAFGPRPEGSAKERAAADYAEGVLESMGYTVKRQEFLLPTKRTCQNLIVDIPGSVHPEQVFVVGGHIDSVSKTVGANDNALGAATVLELASVFKQQAPPCTLRLIVFGAEEYGNRALDQHHLGSRYYVSHLSAEEKKSIIGMVSVDMVGYGNTFMARSLGRAPKSLCYTFMQKAKDMGVKMIYDKAPEWSDHESFEKAGIPSVWLYCAKDTTYHSPRDVVSHLNLKDIEFSGKLLVNVIEDAGKEDSARY
ncbi:MAG: M28 family metallopeptidase [Candidatus Aquicultor sp.]